MHRMHRIFSGNGWLVILGSRKPAPDHRRSQLPAQQPLVLFILCILCIDVHKKISIPRRRPGSPPPHQGGEIPPGARASRPHPFSFIEAAERQREFAGIHPVGGNGIGQSEGDPGCCQSIQVGEMAEAVPGLVRAGRPRSQEARHCAGGTPALPGSQALCGRDARAPRGIPFGRCVPLKQLHIASCPLVVRLYFLPPLSTFFRFK